MKKLWSVEHPAAWCRALACTADGTLVGWYDYKTVHLLDGRSGENRLSIPFPTEHPVGDLKLIPDGTLVGLCEFCYRVTIFDTRAGQILSQWKNKEVGTLAFVSHDDLLVGGKDGHLKLWDWRRQRTRKDYDFSFGTVWSLLLHPDGKRFFALGQDGFALYNLADAKPIYEVKEDLNGVTYNCLDPESKLLAVAGKFRSPSVWDAETGKLVARLKPELGKRFTLKWGGLAFTADGKLLASRVSAPPKPAPYSVELFTFDVATQKIVATCEFPEKKP